MRPVARQQPGAAPTSRAAQLPAAPRAQHPRTRRPPALAQRRGFAGVRQPALPHHRVRHTAPAASAGNGGDQPNQPAVASTPDLPSGPAQAQPDGAGPGARVTAAEAAVALAGVSSSSSSSSGRPITLPGGAAVPLQPGAVLGGGKYTVMEVLGAGSNAVAYRARRPDGSEVALKALSLRSLRDWKQLTLFEREARVLASLDHPAIPRYVDYFEEDDERDRAFVLVQEVVRGKSLGEMVAEGQRASEQEVVRIAGDMLSVLEYLASLRPPVIHRDIKPDNIVLEGGKWGGRVFLVDFGGVQAVASAGELSGLGSTIVGTYGYMAPEQFRGAAEPASDLYGLGATLLYLLSGKPPSAFPQERMRINWRAGMGRSALTEAVLRPAGAQQAQQDPAAVLGALLDGLLEPLAEDRLTAAEARGVMAGSPPSPRGDSRRAATSGFARKRQAGPAPPPSSLREAYLQQGLAVPPGAGLGSALGPARGSGLAPAGRVSRPAGTRVQLTSEGGRLDVVIPPAGLTMDNAFTGAFAVAWNAFVAVWTFSALASGGILFALFSAPFWLAGAQLASGAIGGALTRERLAIGPNKWRLGQQLAVFGSGGDAGFEAGQNERLQEGRTRDLSAARVVAVAFINGEPQTAVELVEGVRVHRFGEGLQLPEQQWVVQEINDHIAAAQGGDLDFDALPPPAMPRVVNDAPAADEDDRWRR